MIRVTNAVQTCYACPSQWDAWTDAGLFLYLRFRHGRGTANLYPDGEGFREGEGVTVASFQDPDPYAGVIGLEEFCARAGLTLAGAIS